MELALRQERAKNQKLSAKLHKVNKRAELLEDELLEVHEDAQKDSRRLQGKNNKLKARLKGKDETLEKKSQNYESMRQILL